jgi:hypothetical protein
MLPDEFPRVWLGDDGVMRIDYGPNALITLDAIRSAYAQFVALSSVPRPILILGARAMNTTNEAEEFANGPQASSMAVALALLMQSNAARMAVNVYHSFRPPPYPIKAFLYEDEAVAWLRGFVQQDGPHA